jgi:hypothetical protein
MPVKSVGRRLPSAPEGRDLRLSGKFRHPRLGRSAVGQQPLRKHPGGKAQAFLAIKQSDSFVERLKCQRNSTCHAAKSLH